VTRAQAAVRERDVKYQLDVELRTDVHEKQMKEYAHHLYSKVRVRCLAVQPHANLFTVLIVLSAMRYYRSARSRQPT